MTNWAMVFLCQKQLNCSGLPLSVSHSHIFKTGPNQPPAAEKEQKSACAVL